MIIIVTIGLSLDWGGLGENGLTAETWKVNILTIGQRWIGMDSLPNSEQGLSINCPLDFQCPNWLIDTNWGLDIRWIMSIGFGWILGSNAHDSDQSLPAILSGPWSCVQWPL